MNIGYTKHGAERLKQRCISKKEVKENIDKGRKIDAQSGSRKSTYKNLKGILVVIYNVKDTTSVEVITAYYE